MKKALYIILFLVGIISFETQAQTTFWTYDYTVTPDGARFKEQKVMDGYRTMTFSNNANFVAITNSKGVSTSNAGYKYSYHDNGFDVYTPGYSGSSSSAQQLGSSWANSALDDIYGAHAIGVSFNKGWTIMLVHLSNGNNYVWKRAPDPTRPNVKY